MTRDDLQIFSTALAFVAVLTNGQAIKPEDAPAKTLQLAEQIRDFCVLHAAPPIPPGVLVEETDVAAIDQLIEHHAQELSAKEITVLPDDRITLLRLQDRLQHRKARRVNRVLYAALSDEKLADLVLSYLDEEIEETRPLT